MRILRVQHWIDRLGLAIRPNQPVRSLSLARMQPVEIAEAIFSISSDQPAMVALADRILGEVRGDHDCGRMSTAIMGHIHAAEAA